MDKQKNRFYIKSKYLGYLLLVAFGLLANLDVRAEQSRQALTTKLKKDVDLRGLIPLLVEVKVNTTLLPEIINCYKDSLGRIWVSGDDLLAWQMRLPPSLPIIYKDQKFYLLDSYSNLHYTLDQYAMQLSIQADAKLFNSQFFDPYGKRLGALRPSKPGAFVNYDGVALRNTNQGMNQTNLSALLGLGLFNRLGVGTANVLAYNRLDNDITNLNFQPNKLIRLDTTWTLDKPEKISSWRFGDAITGSIFWSGAARFAGIQYATNFNTQPNLVTFPLPGYQGEASIPSTVDVFVNSVLNQEQMVNNGPYTFNNIPVISGAGTVQVVTQDILGRSQVISFPYYASPLLLKPDLVNFSYELGFLRNNYALNSNDYGQPLAVATYQRGITDHLTLGTHVEVLSDQQIFGFSANYLLKSYGVASLAIAGGHNTFGKGGLLEIGFVHQGPKLSYGFNTTVASINYFQLGDMSNRPPNLISQLFLGYSLANFGSLSASYTLVNNRNFSEGSSFTTIPSARLLTATYNHNLFKNISLGIGFVGDLRNSQTNQAFITLVFSPDNAHIVSNYASWQNHQFLDALQLSKPTPLGKGYGYNFFASNNDNRYAGADLTVQTEIGSYTARLGKGKGQANYELDASGSAIYFAGDGFLARKLTNSFALIQVPGYSNVDVFYQHQLMGHTDSNGNLLITELLPYQENILEIEPTTLPLDTQIETITKTVTPYYYSGVLARFPVKHLQGLVAHLLMPNGKFVPVGAEISLDNDKGIPYVVGYDGEFYLPDIAQQILTGIVTWDDKRYCFTLNVPKSTEAIIELGNVLCY